MSVLTTIEVSNCVVTETTETETIKAVDTWSSSAVSYTYIVERVQLKCDIIKKY